jgi:hypothetical protein
MIFRKTRYWFKGCSILFCLVLLSGCGGTKVLKEPVPYSSTEPLSVGSDDALSATLDWVIFRDGPGTWAKNADWDEYFISVRNTGNDSLQITSVAIVDSLGTRIEPRADRKQLVKGARETKRRYKDEGIKVKAGLSGKVLVGTGVVAAAGTSGLGAAAMAGGGAAAGAAAVVVLVPALAVGGVVRGLNNSEVNQEIESRQIRLPVSLEKDEKKDLVLFYPLSPSPRRIEIAYLLGEEDRVLHIDTESALEGLHLSAEEK